MCLHIKVELELEKQVNIIIQWKLVVFIVSSIPTRNKMTNILVIQKIKTKFVLLIRLFVKNWFFLFKQL